MRKWWQRWALGPWIASGHLGQYLRPSLVHIPVQRYWHPDEFDQLGQIARADLPMCAVVRWAQQLSRCQGLRLDAIKDHVVGGAISPALIDGASPAAKQGGEPQQHGDLREERGAVSMQRRPDSNVAVITVVEL